MIRIRSSLPKSFIKEYGGNDYRENYEVLNECKVGIIFQNTNVMPYPFCLLKRFEEDIISLNHQKSLLSMASVVDLGILMDYDLEYSYRRGYLMWLLFYFIKINVC